MKLQYTRLLHSNWNKLVRKFYITVHHFHARVQSLTCSTYMEIFCGKAFRLEIPFWANLVQKIKIASFRWNLLLILTQIWRIKWWYSLVMFLKGNILFMENVFQKMKMVCWSLNLERRLIRIWKIWWWFPFYCLWDLTGVETLNTPCGCFCCFKTCVNFPQKHQWRRLNGFIFLMYN